MASEHRTIEEGVEWSFNADTNEAVFYYGMDKSFRTSGLTFKEAMAVAYMLKDEYENGRRAGVAAAKRAVEEALK